MHPVCPGLGGAIFGLERALLPFHIVGIVVTVLNRHAFPESGVRACERLWKREREATYGPTQRFIQHLMVHQHGMRRLWQPALAMEQQLRRPGGSGMQRLILSSSPSS